MIPTKIQQNVPTYIMCLHTRPKEFDVTYSTHFLSQLDNFLACSNYDVSPHYTAHTEVVTSEGVRESAT